MWDGARAVIARAADLGLTLALENYARTPGNRLDQVLGAIELFHSPVLGTNVDVANYVQNGQEPIPAIQALSQYVRYVHLKDVKYSPEGKVATYLGAGTLPYRDILAALDATGQDFPLCFEFGGEGDPEGVLAKSLAYLKSLEA
jgi:sugar phosphate isomerase/epimerase